MTDPAAESQVFQTVTFLPGRLGLNLVAAADRLDKEEARVRANLRQPRLGELVVRPGQTLFGSGAGAVDVHSIERMELPSDSTYTRFWGAGTFLLRGQSMADILNLEGDFSGDPLTLLPYRPERTGTPWMLVADRLKMRQVAPDRAPIALGLAPPAAAVTAALAEILTTRICAFDSTDDSVAATWTLTAGVDRSETPIIASAPTAADITGLSGDAVEFSTVPGAAQKGYASIIAKSVALDLTKLQAGAHPATDEDLIHLWLRCDLPAKLEAIRVYFVCSSGFDPAVIPGSDEAINTDAFVKEFRPHDFTNFVENLTDALTAGGVSRNNDVLTEYFGNPDHEEILPDETEALLTAGAAITVGASIRAGASGLRRQRSEQLLPGRDTWSEFGNVGRPLRRGEFMRIGNAGGRDWSTITGILLVVQTKDASAVSIACDDWFLTGGFDLDSTDATATPYDWRYVHFNTVTGDKSNPSPEMAEADFLDCLRQRVNLQPVATGNADVRQLFYRRGGSLGTDWFFTGMNSADGALFTDEDGDSVLASADTIEIDNDQPISTVDDDGTTITAQPLPVVFGPIDEIIFGIGDPYRPGYLYWCKPGRPGSWPSENIFEVCAPSEQLMTGFELAGQGWVFSRKRLYNISPNITANGQIAVQSTPCLFGIAGRWAHCGGPGGRYFVSAGPETPGIYVTAGGVPEYLSRAIEPLFRGETIDEYAAIDLTQEHKLRLAVSGHILWFFYQDVNGLRQILLMDLITKEWWNEYYANPIAMIAPERGASSEPTILMGGAGNGSVYLQSGTSDDGIAIQWGVRSGDLDGGEARADKLLGDLVFDLDMPGGVLDEAGNDTITAPCFVQTYLNNRIIANASMPIPSLTGRRRYMFHPFGEVPQKARNLTIEIRGTAPTTGEIPAIYLAGVSFAREPEQIMKRATLFEVLADTEVFLTGCTIVCDTNAQVVDAAIEITLGGARTTAAAIQITAPGRRLRQFSWPAARAEQVRLRPLDDCIAWILYSIEWHYAKEPARIAHWDTINENLGDTYHTGVDLDVHTFGVSKQVEVWVDNAIVTDPATGEQFFTIRAAQRKIIHLSWTPGRGHLYRLVSRDTTLGLLYGHKWHVEAEPSEQTNWNQNFTIEGTLGDKIVKGVLLECDTFNQPKTVEIQIDGVTHTTIEVTQNGRGVQQFAFAPGIGRVLRLLPTDNNLGRLYSLQWIFDEEPLKLTRWETSRIDHGVTGQQSIYGAFITLKSTADVVVTIGVYNQLGMLAHTLQATIPSTGGAKQQVWVTFDANKGVLFDYVLTSAQGFWLYREESSVMVLPWGAMEPKSVKPFGSDDLDKVRSLSRATAIAQAVGK